jgi:hypothetical protein
MKSVILRVWILAFALSPCISSSGELECGIGNCRIDGVFQSVKWKPSNCFQPNKPPMYFGSSSSEFNDAVSAFNNWQAKVRSYISCARSEAANDVQKMQEVIANGEKQLEQEMSAEVERARSTLQMMRPR